MANDKFEGITVIKKANIYFNGNVTSRTILFADGTRKTLGIMLPGDYEFDASTREVVEILSGETDILLPGADKWKTVKAGETYEAPANSTFKLKVKTLVDYCCSYD
jgi:hypothetical protein